MTRALGLDCKGYEALSFIQWIVGLGRPLAVQLKEALEPIRTLWFFGPSTISGFWASSKLKQKGININEWNVMSCLICDLSLDVGAQGFFAARKTRFEEN